MARNLEYLLRRLSTITSVEELKANLAEVAFQCDENYAHAERLDIHDKSELLSRVVHAKAMYANMLNLEQIPRDVGQRL